MASNTEPALQFDSIEDTIQAFKNGEFIIVLDSPDRENEGDPIMAFMVRYTSGLICAPITREIATRLQSPQMVTENTDPKGTAYTVSIDLADPSSITTSISAHDRARTCQALASPTSSASDFHRPGHIIPLQACRGGVRQRKGHTEAVVEFCRLAGKQPVGVIAELVEDGLAVEGVAEIRGDNAMMSGGCLEFGKRWGMKVCTIEDVVEYVERTEAGFE
ncbi:DHBP synthase RibB-like alpha/beta domain-containing protein [Aspergillus pseudodeflectus]|uniref:3,4-dihydroxy-2-butanone-4-phosphate synthase n=1 Tax=Aspergillus pseudodeflectus TaxID=176178 RepID=A0ABR4L3R7_9EURO